MPLFAQRAATARKRPVLEQNACFYEATLKILESAAAQSQFAVVEQAPSIIATRMAARTCSASPAGSNKVTYRTGAQKVNLTTRRCQEVPDLVRERLGVDRNRLIADIELARGYKERS